MYISGGLLCFIGIAFILRQKVISDNICFNYFTQITLSNKVMQHIHEIGKINGDIFVKHKIINDLYNQWFRIYITTW